jgi:hypothetical protein
VGTQYVKSFAVQRRPDDNPYHAAEWDASVLYWDRLENVHCFNIDAPGFMNELAKRYKSKFP